VREPRPITRASLLLYALAFASAGGAAVSLFYGAFGSSGSLVWTSVALSAAAVVLAGASVLVGRR
jgi:hypothetical protein